MIFAFKGKGALVVAGLMLAALLVSPGVAFAKPPDGSTKDQIKELEARVSALEAQVEALMTFVQALEPFISVNPDPMDGLAGPHIIFEGANVHVRSGSGATDDGWNYSDPTASVLTGLGNLVVGYNEDNASEDEWPKVDDRTGSHNLIVGVDHTYSRFGGFIAGLDNTTSASFASVCGGDVNVASGAASSVTGGSYNEASGRHSSVSGGDYNKATGYRSSVSGGNGNVAGAWRSSIAGGSGNEASGERSSISGGSNNVASGDRSSVSGGRNRNAPTADSWAAGSLLQPN